MRTFRLQLTQYIYLMRLPYGPNVLWCRQYARLGRNIVTVIRLLPFARLYIVNVTPIYGG